MIDQSMDRKNDSLYKYESRSNLILMTIDLTTVNKFYIFK